MCLSMSHYTTSVSACVSAMIDINRLSSFSGSSGRISARVQVFGLFLLFTKEFDFT
jgi:hypothetical protein